MRRIVGTARFVASWTRDRPPAHRTEISVEGDRGPAPADLYLPAGRWNGEERTSPGLPAWIVLHGLTRPGRAHPSLVRFAGALASTGARVLVPEIPEWRALDLAPERTAPAVRGCLRTLRSGREDPPAVGLVGFSFGGPQALAAAAEPDLESALSGVVSWGGYADLERTLRFQFTGEHEWRGRRHRLRPDPYGRWIVGANLLPEVPRFAEAEDVARALRTLAGAASERQIPSGDPALEPLKEEVRIGIARSRRDLFDLFCSPAGRDPHPDEVEELVRILGRSVAERRPLLDPLPRLGRLRLPVRLLHARDDQLIPFSETLRLREALPEGLPARATITGLFAHSGEGRITSLVHGVREAVRFARALEGVLTLV